MTNVYSPTWDEERETGRFANTPGTRSDARIRIARINMQTGGEKLGASLYELEPGAAQSPVHNHHANEEMLVVLKGRPTLRTTTGTRQLGPGDVVSCLVGRRGAHRVENTENEPALVLMVCTLVYPDVIEHPDEGDVVVVTAAPFLHGPQGDDGFSLSFRRSDARAGTMPAQGGRSTT